MNYKHKLKTNKYTWNNLYTTCKTWWMHPHTFRNVWIGISIFTYDFSLLGLVANQADRICDS